MTAPSVAAASEYQKPPPKIPSFTKTQPPIKEPTKPRTMSAMQPKPRPRAIFPASHPAMRPIRSQPTKLGRKCTANVSEVSRPIDKFMPIQPPEAAMQQPTKRRASLAGILLEVGLQISEGHTPRIPCLSCARLLLGHAVNCPEAEHQIATGNSNDFAVWKKAR